jgi:hypothetical protein
LSAASALAVLHQVGGPEDGDTYAAEERKAIQCDAVEFVGQRSASQQLVDGAPARSRWSVVQELAAIRLNGQYQTPTPEHRSSEEPECPAWVADRTNGYTRG